MSNQKAIRNLDSNLTVMVNEDNAVMLAQLKAAGVKMGKTSLTELLEGKRDVVNGFSLVDVELDDEELPNNDGVSDGAIIPTAAKPEDKPATATMAAPAPRTPRQTKTIRSVEPKGKIKAVRKGTKIADGLEMLLKGTTVAELEKHEVSDDIVDFVNRRVTKRGYGVKVDGDTISLVLPAGVTGVLHNTVAEPVVMPPAAAVADVKPETAESATQE